ncbi:FAD binding domain-containing protein [Decorospora gaudefroyi]|uniref:FAD binding domain-containing protein n=1 Tax=Decorospora gaudefroyi TaxID=184978 RepID=A0A6A5K3R9_9PLEO|nr:FAD binding domain-containing protein [Decorospora gaudefroyi]
MDKFVSLALAALLLGAKSTFAAPTEATTTACTEIKDALPGKVLTPGLLAAEYMYETQQYWSTTLRTIDPACIVQPDSAQDISIVIKILNKYPSVQFATRSGGHDPNVGHATVEDGVLITMTDLVGATYDAEEDVAYVRPGGDWNDVISDLEQSGVAVSGGRLGIVGVGGLLLGGGLSFLNAQEGMVADNIIEWETVMANGSVVYVDAAANPDLAQAMRGSVGQFGIVTQFKAKVHHMGDVWGGSCTYDETKDEELYAALHDFIPNGPQDPKAAIIFSDLVLAADINTKLIFYFYDAPSPPTTGPFADFLEIPGLSCTTKTQTYSELLKANGAPVGLLNARSLFRTYTVPYIASRPQMYSEIRDQLANITATFLNTLPLIRAIQFSVDFQPLPALFGQISESKGGNAMGLTASDPDRIILIYQGAWNSPEDDELAYELAREITAWLDEVVPVWMEEAGLPPDMYLPLFINDAMFDQPVLQSYREYEKFEALQRSVDPDGLFRTRFGGFKY